MAEKRLTRRDAIKKVVYITPFILTLAATPSFAQSGSGSFHRHRKTTWQFLWWRGRRTRWHFHPDDD